MGLDIVLELTDRIRKLELENDLLKKQIEMPCLFDFKVKREELGYTLRQVQDKTEISNAYLSQLETGKIKTPSFQVVKKLHDLYFQKL